MATFTPNASWTQSTDGKTLTLTDTSNWVGNDQGYLITDFTRKFILKNSIGTVLAELPLTGSNLSVTYSVTKDEYYSAELVITGTPSFSKVINFGTTMFEYNLLDSLLAIACDCGCGTKQSEKIRWGFMYLNRAERVVLYGNGTKFNSYINASFAWLK